MTTVATETVTATTAAARDLLAETIAETTTTPTLPAAATGIESVRTATLGAIAVTAAATVEAIVAAIVRGPSEDGIVIEVLPAATLDATTNSGSTGGTETLTMTDAVAAEGITGATREGLGGRRVAGLLRRHPRRENLLQT